MTEPVLYDVTDRVATITLNRPDAMNTMSPDLIRLAHGYLADAASDEGVRAVILTGNGRAFCAGGDLTSMAGRSRGADDSDRPRSVAMSIASLRHNMQSSQLLHEMPKLTIAAINGACAGAGLAWACACDVRYASETAVFNTAFLTAGRSGDFGGTWTLQRLVGPARARELYLMPEKFRADDALRMGLVSEVLAPDELIDFARQKAEQAASRAPLTFASIKANLNDAEHLSFAELLDREAERQIRCGLTDDAREAALSFLEKRTPTFTGR